MARRKKRIHRHLQDYFLPHRGNKYRPRVFSLSSVAVIIGCVLLLGLLYILATGISSRGNSFASVLPAALTAFTNQDRAAQSLSQLESDPLLARAAQLKADDMAAKGYFSHVSPDGTTPWHWLDEVGYEYSYAGENLAVDFVDSKDVEEAWMNSPTHRANIVKANYTKIGIGVAEGMYEGHETTFVVQFFAATPEAAPEVARTETTSSDDPRVLGAESPQKAAAATTPTAASKSDLTVAEQITTAPKHVLATILGGLLVLVLGLLAVMLAVHAHVRAKSIEMVGGAVVLVCVLGCCLYYTLDSGNVILPSDSQSASAALAL